MKMMFIVVLSFIILLNSCDNSYNRTVFEPMAVYEGKIFGGDGDDRGMEVIETSDDNYVIVGATKSFGNGGYDIYLIKIDKSGNMLWQKTYGGTGDDIGYSVCQTSDNGFIITGGTKSYSDAVGDIFLLKTDSSGNQIWFQTYGSASKDAGFSVKQTSDNGYVVAAVYSETQTYVFKTDSSGNASWFQLYPNKPSTIYKMNLTILHDDAFLVASTVYNSSFINAYMIKINSSGSKVWETTNLYDSFDATIIYKCIELPDNSLTCAGYNDPWGTTSSLVYMQHTNNSGALSWKKTLGIDNCIAKDIIRSSKGDLVMLGSETGEGAGYNNIYLLCTDTNGNKKWSKTYAGLRIEYDKSLGESLLETNDGGFLLLANTNSLLESEGYNDIYDIILIKTNSKGQWEW